MLPSQEQRTRAGRALPKKAPALASKRSRTPGWVRRVAVPALGRAAAWCPLLLLVGWAGGLVLNDRTVWSQFLWWIPTGFACGAAWIGLAVSRVCEMIGVRLAGARARPFLLIGACLATGWFVAFEIRVVRAIAPPSDALRADESAVRVAYWNAAWSRPAGAQPVFDRLAADIVIVANPRPGEATKSFLGWMRARAIAWDELDGDRSQTHLLKLRQQTVISRWPIVASGVEPFGSEGDGGSAISRATQTGVGFVTLDIEGGAITLWIVDLPSTPLMPRTEMLRRAASISAGFPDAHLVIGDFNTPRGSASLEAFVGGMTSVDRAVGSGLAATWPRPAPQLSIDLAFTRDPLRPAGMDQFDPAPGFHRGIVVDLALRRAETVSGSAAEPRSPGNPPERSDRDPLPAPSE